jgi:hypothetical protein
LSIIVVCDAVLLSCCTNVGWSVRVPSVSQARQQSLVLTAPIYDWGWGYSLRADQNGTRRGWLAAQVGRGTPNSMLNQPAKSLP